MCNMSLDCVSVHAWSIGTVDGRGEGQVETGHVDRLRVVMDEHEACTERPRWLED